jgi:LPS export ABC transporter protein LptC
VRNTVVMIVLAILAGATWVATWQGEDLGAPTDLGTGAEPLRVLTRGARLTGMDEQGRPTYRIFAERLDEIPGEERLQLTGVNVDYQPADETPWLLSAASAKYARDGSQLDLLGNVQVRSTPADGTQAVTIVTEQLLFSPDTSSAESDESVEIRVGGWQLSAVGLRTLLKEDTLELESQVHGTLLP